MTVEQAVSMDILTDLSTACPTLHCPRCNRLTIVEADVAFALGHMDSQVAHLSLLTFHVCIDVDGCGYRAQARER